MRQGIMVSAIAASVLVGAAPAAADGVAPVATFEQFLSNGSRVAEPLPLTQVVGQGATAGPLVAPVLSQATPDTTAPASSGGDIQAAAVLSELVAPNTCDYWNWFGNAELKSGYGATSTQKPNYPSTKAMTLWDESFVGVGGANLGSPEEASTVSTGSTGLYINSSVYQRVDISYPWSVVGHVFGGSHYSPLAVLTPFSDNKSTSEASYAMSLYIQENSLRGTRVVSDEKVQGNNGTGGATRAVDESWATFGSAPPVLSIGLRAGSGYYAGLEMKTNAKVDPVPGMETDADSYFTNGGDELGHAMLFYNRWAFTLQTGYSISACQA
jgi:hypothetical protein